MNNQKSRFRFLSNFFNNDVYLLIKKYNDTQNEKEQNELSLILVKCIELMHIPFNDDDTKELISSLTDIRTYLCQRHEIEVAQESFARIGSLIQFLMDEGYFKKGAVKRLRFLMLTLTKFQYEEGQSEKVSIEVSAKFKYDIIIASSNKITENLRLRLNFLSGFLNTNVFELIANFVYSLSLLQQTKISYWLVTYIELLHEAFNKNDTDKFIQSLIHIRTHNCQKNTLSSLNNKLYYVRTFVTHMFKVGYFHKGSLDQLTALLSTISESQYEVFKSKIIPKNIYTKFNYSFTARDISGNTLISSPSANTEKKLEYISGFLNSDIFDLITNYIYRIHKNQQTGLTLKLVTYIEVLHKAFNNRDIDTLIQSLTYIRADTCQRHTFLSSIYIFRYLQFLIKHITKAGYFKEGSVDKLATLLVCLTDVV